MVISLVTSWLTCYLDRQLRSVVGTCWHIFDLPQDKHIVSTVQYTTKADVFAVQKVCRSCRYEELAAVRVRTAVGHGQDW